MNTLRSAISLVTPNKIGEHPLVSRFFKAVFRDKPPTPKYLFTWDVSVVLNYLGGLQPLEGLSLRELSWKLATLLALTTAHRAQTLAKIKIQNIIEVEDVMYIKIEDLIKTSRPGTFAPLLHLPKFTAKPELCAVATIKEYIRRTADMRGHLQNLMITLNKPHRPVTAQTISNWVKNTMQKSGLDISMFSSHSTRHAATSHAFAKGLSLDVIRKTADWSEGSQVFARFYQRTAIPSQSEFAKLLLK